MKPIKIDKADGNCGRKIRALVIAVGTGMSFALFTLSANNIDHFTQSMRPLFQLPSLAAESYDIKITHRLCPKCGGRKSLSEFYKNKSKPDGHESHCKVCVLKKKKRKIKQLGGTIELEVTMKRSHNFIAGLDLVLDIITAEVTKNA